MSKHVVTFAWEYGNKEEGHVMSRHLPRHFKPRVYGLRTASAAGFRGADFETSQQPTGQKSRANVLVEGFEVRLFESGIDLPNFRDCFCYRVTGWL